MPSIPTDLDVCQRGDYTQTVTSLIGEYADFHTMYVTNSTCSDELEVIDGTKKMFCWSKWGLHGIALALTAQVIAKVLANLPSVYKELPNDRFSTKV